LAITVVGISGNSTSSIDGVDGVDGIITAVNNNDTSSLNATMISRITVLLCHQKGE
jgi:hypothetical protein